MVAVHDLDAAGDFYQRLGFQVGERNRHPWGTENRLIQFNHSFIELITVGSEINAIPDHEPSRFSFGAFVRDYLRQREGLAMLVLDSEDAKADAMLFAREGIGSFEPIFFERKGQRSDGSETHVAFTLAFASNENTPDCGFFVCQQHYPENFWSPTFQRHDNGASAITAVGMTAANPGSFGKFLAAFSGAQAKQDVDGGLSINVRDGRLTVTPDRMRTTLRLTWMTISIRDIIAQAERLRAAEIHFNENTDGLCIPGKAALGLGICFEGSRPKVSSSLRSFD